jgi:hypothetical protein
VATVRDLLFRAENGFFKLECDVFAEIGAALCACATPGTGASTEQVAKAEKLAEDVVKVLKDRCIEAWPRARAADSGVAEAVVQAALFGVGEDGVCLAAFLEFLFRIRIIGIAVGVVLQRQLTVGALDLLVAGAALNAQDLVVVSLYIAWQSYLSQSYLLSFWWKELTTKDTQAHEGKISSKLFNQCFELRATFTIAGRSRRSFSL